MLRRSDFIAARYAFSLVFANLGIAIAARMPMMTTTIKSSIRVNPFLFRDMTCFLLRKLPLVFNYKTNIRGAEQRKMRRYRRILPEGNSLGCRLRRTEGCGPTNQYGVRTN